jgi:hypothetical protein
MSVATSSFVRTRRVAPSTVRLFAAMCAVVLFAASLVASVGQSEAVAAPDPVGCEGYPQPRVFMEAQSWWQPTLSGSENFGHVHAATCFPRTHLPDGRVNAVSGKVRLDVKVQLHENPGQLRFVRVHLTDAKSNQQVVRVDVNEFCVKGGPRWSDAAMGCVWWVPVEFDTTKANYDGFQEVRLAASIRHSNTDSMFNSSGWQLYLKNGKPVLHYKRNSDGSPRELTEGRGWYEGAKYTTARLESRLPYTVSGIWEPSVGMVKGSGGVEVRRSFASIDPNFHHGNRGIVVLDRAGSYRGKLRIDTTKLADGPHRLLLRADAPCDGTSGNDCGRRADGSSLNVSTNSGALAITFHVKNG